MPGLDDAGTQPRTEVRKNTHDRERGGRGRLPWDETLTVRPARLRLFSK
jgi:hypothetical protein